MNRSDFEKKVRKFCTNMIYIFIPDKTLQSGAFGKHTNKIYAKRQSQINYLVGLSTAAGMAGNLDPVREWIKDEMAKTYEPLYDPRTGKNETATPELIIYHLSQGDAVNGINWSAGIYGIGKTVTNDFGSNGMQVNSDGTFSQNGQTLSTNNIIRTWNKKGTVKTAAYFDGTNTYTAKYSKSKGWYAYSTSNQAGNVTKVGGGTLTAANGDFWENINNILGQLNELVSTFASWLSGETAQSLSPSQLEDGWMEPESSSSDSGLASIALIGAGALALGVIAGGKKKKSKTTKNKEI